MSIYINWKKTSTEDIGKNENTVSPIRVETNPQAKRFQEGKIRVELVPNSLIEETAKVMGFGAEKYGDFNWVRGMDWSKCIASLKRHILAYEQGEDYDKESGLLHLAHASCNIAFLLEYYRTCPELDNRRHWYKKPFKKLFLDLDDVIAGFSDSFLEHFEMDKEEAHDWNDHRFVNKLEQVKDNKDFWLSIKPLIHPKDICYPIAGYCTARSIPEEWIQEWLNKNGFPVAPILQVSFGESKVEKLKEAGCDIMIDDNIKNFVELNSNGILCYLFSRSHNMKYSVGHLRIDNLCKFLKTLL